MILIFLWMLYSFVQFSIRKQAEDSAHVSASLTIIIISTFYIMSTYNIFPHVTLSIAQGVEFELTEEERAALGGNARQFVLLRHGQSTWNQDGRIQVVN